MKKQTTIEAGRFTLIESVPEGFEEINLYKDYSVLYRCSGTGSYFIVYMYGRWNSPKYMIKLNHLSEQKKINFKNEYVDYLKKTYPINELECRTKYCHNKVIVMDVDVSIKKNQYCADCWVYRKGVY